MHALALAMIVVASLEPSAPAQVPVVEGAPAVDAEGATAQARSDVASGVRAEEAAPEVESGASEVGSGVRAGEAAPEVGRGAAGEARPEVGSGARSGEARPEVGRAEPAGSEGAKARPRWWGPEPRPKVSGYGGPALRLSGLHGSFAALVGIEGGINVVQRVTIGASLLWLLGPVEAGSYARGAASRVDLNYGGLVVDVAYVRGKKVAGTIGGLLGGGGACLQNPNNGDCADRTSFFVGEPRAGLRVVLAPIVRLHVAMGYRFVVGRAWSGPPEPRLGGPSGSVTLEFGWF